MAQRPHPQDLERAPKGDIRDSELTSQLECLQRLRLTTLPPTTSVKQESPCKFPYSSRKASRLVCTFTLPQSEWHFTVYATVKHSTVERCGLRNPDSLRIWTCFSSLLMLRLILKRAICLPPDWIYSRYAEAIPAICVRKGGNDQHEHTLGGRLSIAKPGSFPPFRGFLSDPGLSSKSLLQSALTGTRMEPEAERRTERPKRYSWRIVAAKSSISNELRPRLEDLVPSRFQK